MAKNDYHVLAYRLLAYLYACLKAEETPNVDYIRCNTKAFPIGEKYWNYLIANLFNDGYITGVALVPLTGQSDPGIKMLPSLNITPKGIEYLQENSAMSRARDFLKTLKEIVPGL